jgi:hypothetical protein
VLKVLPERAQISEERDYSRARCNWSPTFGELYLEGDATVRAEPFEAIELDLARLWRW